MTNFSATECISFGWVTFKKRPWFLIGVVFLYLIFLGTVSSLLGKAGADGSTLRFMATLINWALSIFASMSFTSFMLKAHDDVEHVQMKDFWNPGMYWHYLGAMILMGLAIVGGLILVIVPGIIFAIMFSFASYIVIEHNMGPIAALKESARMTKGYKLELFFLMLMSIGITILGVICLFVGIFVAMPITALAAVHAYRMLSGKADAIIPATPSEPVVS